MWERYVGDIAEIDLATGNASQIEVSFNGALADATYGGLRAGVELVNYSLRTPTLTLPLTLPLTLTLTLTLTQTQTLTQTLTLTVTLTR